MKKNVFIVFLIISILLIVIIKNSNKKLITYKLNKNGIDFSISEKHNKENYYIEIKTKEHIYPIRLDGISGKRIVDNIYYYEDNNYECILPEFKSRINFDIMCFNKDILYDYSEIKNLDSSLDEFASSLKSYNLNHFSDDLTRTKIISDTTFYESNVIDKNAYITSYKGLTSIDNSLTFFEKDVYKNTLGTFLNDYYVVPNYDSLYEFEYLYVINLKNQKISKIKCKESISFDSYIQGIVENKIYLYDKNNEKQYQIDIYKNDIKMISRGNSIKYYKNDEWKTISIALANKEKYFEFEDLYNLFDGFIKTVKVGNFYYLFKELDYNYELYRVDEDNLNVKKYITKVPNLNIAFKNDYLYYVDGDTLYYYSDTTGLRKILKNSELKFNSTIKYYIY